MEPSWQPDPTGRHHYRWWDGAAWTDSVADHGVASTDPFRPAGAATVTVSTTPRIGDEREPESPTGEPSGPAARPAYATEPLPVGGGIAKWIVLGLVLLVAAGVVVFFTVFRKDEEVLPATMGVSTGRLEGRGDYIARDIRLDDGDAIRFRVEGDPDRDLVTYFMAKDDTASGQQLRWFTDYGTNMGITDPEELLSELTEADDVLTEGDIQDDLREYSILQVSDRCCAGVPDVDTFVAAVPGEYRIVVIEAEGRDAQVRIIVDKYRAQLFPYAEITDTLDNDAFFTDTGFFEDTEPYEPSA